MRRVIAGLAAVVGLVACGPLPQQASRDEPSAPPTWSYGTYEDPMRGTKTYSASLDSRERFPGVIASDTSATSLVLHKHGRRQEVSIENPKLQFTCSAFTDTVVAVRFDRGPVERYPCTEEKTSQYGVAFILRADKFIGKLKRAKAVTIEAEVFQRGDIQMDFDNAGLLWPPA